MPYHTYTRDLSNCRTFYQKHQILSFLCGNVLVCLDFGGTMKGGACIYRYLVTIQSNKLYFCYYDLHISPKKAYFFSTKIEPSGQRVQEAEEVVRSPSCAAQVFRNFGCSESQLHSIFNRQPSLRYASNLESKLNLLCKLGIKSANLVKMINCRPRLLSCRFNHIHERVDDLQSLFGSRALFIRAIVRNPSLLLYDVDKTIKPVFSLYEKMGLSRSDLISMLLLRPTLISRTHMTPEKLEYIRRTGISSASKMYKYVTTIFGVSRIETIREKVANLEKFGFSEDEVLELFGRHPLVLTLSVEKVQRNMTFVMGTMKLPAKTVCDYPFLLFYNLEGSLRPRVLLAGKIQDMGLLPQINGPAIFRALRMSEKRFLDVFIKCQEEEVGNELLLYYSASKGVKRLAESAKKASHTSGFPF